MAASIVVEAPKLPLPAERERASEREKVDIRIAAQVAKKEKAAESMVAAGLASPSSGPRVAKKTLAERARQSLEDSTPRVAKKTLRRSLDDSDLPSTNTKKRDRHSLDDADLAPARLRRTRLTHDSGFNFIPGSCFEIGTSLSILDKPGQAGVVMDGHARQLAVIIGRVYDDADPIGRQSITVGGKTQTVREYFTTKILKEFHPVTSDQIGRSMTSADGPAWYTGRGKDWLCDQLMLSSADGRYQFGNMLTKIRAISAFGTILRELSANPTTASVAGQLLGKDVGVFTARSGNLTTKIRHAGFDNPQTRARTERTPVVSGRPITDFPQVEVSLADAGPLGLGFGQVYDAGSMRSKGAGGEALISEYRESERSKGRQGMPRRGQDMVDHTRPGLVGKSGMENLPPAFEERGLREALTEHAFDHGSGADRWRLHGSYPRSAWEHDFPAAGAHSGGTSDILLALDCMSEESIFGDEERVLPAGLLISSFMNFGGYHSFVETFPIVQAVASDSNFVVAVGEQQEDLYEEMAGAVSQYAPAAGSQVTGYLKAYDQSGRVAE